MKPIKIIMLSLLLFGIGVPCGAQSVVNRMLGTDFWMMFLKQFDGSVEDGMSINCFFVLTAAEESDVTISYSATGWDTLVTVPAGGAVRVSVPDDQSPTHHFGAKIDSSAWHIQATAPISVTAYNDINYSYDATAILPTDALRTYYITQVYQAFPHGPEVGIVAPYDSTRVWSVLEKNICQDTGFFDRAVYNAGDTMEFLLMRGQTCLLRNAGWTATQVTWISECSLNGLRLHSDKPIAVFQGNNAAYVPYGGDSQAPDHLYDQCIPVEYWGDHFVIEPVIGRQPYTTNTNPQSTYHNYGDMVRVMAKDDNCHISLDGQEVAVLQSGQIYSFVLSDHPAILPASWGMDFYHSPCIELNATSPVMVCYYITGIYFGGSPGDPSVMTVPPIENGVSHAIFKPHNTPVTTQHWINIVTPSVYASQITLDGANIGSLFSTTAGGYSYACIPVSQATHTIDAGNGIFIAYLYGLGYAESYLHTVASNTENKPYNVWTQRSEACVGDSITVGIMRFDNSLSATWYIDGVWIADAADSLAVVFDSTGTHQIMTVVSPIGDTVYTYITVESYNTSYSTATICSGGSYIWRGQELSAGGNYTDTLSVMGGCDSVLVLQLKVTPAPVTTTYDTLCQGGTYLWHGRTLQDEGTYIDTVDGPEGCDSIVTLELSVLTTPQISLTVNEDCNSKKYNIVSVINPGDEVSPFWTSLPPDSTLDGQQWNSIVVSPTSATLYTLAFDGRCPNDTSILITPSEWPVAAMEVHPVMLSLDNLQLVARDVSLNATERTWYVDDEVAGHSPTLYYSASAAADSVWLMLVVNRGECTDTALATIPVSNSVIWVPNVFTPNENNNQRFIVKGDDVTLIDLYIYARNGVLAWYGDNPSEGWDGTLKDGTPCPQGTYTWILRYIKSDQPNIMQKAVGTVTLLR